jgi:hypothetical protein
MQIPRPSYNLNLSRQVKSYFLNICVIKPFKIKTLNLVDFYNTIRLQFKFNKPY